MDDIVKDLVDLWWQESSSSNEVSTRSSSGTYYSLQLIGITLDTKSGNPSLPSSVFLLPFPSQPKRQVKGKVPV